jgi:hypothetical protein
MDFQVKEHKPFGPLILEAKCPDFIVESLNDYVDNYKHNPVHFDLLSRNIKNPFIEHDFADEIGLIDFMNYLGQEYLDMNGRTKYGDIEPDDSYYYKVLDTESNGDGDESILHFDDTNFIDAWVNIYGESDFTPVHTHGGDLASVMILKLPEDPEGENEYENWKNEPCPNGNLSFLYDTGQSHRHVATSFEPEQYVGMTLLFPPNLRHAYYPHKLKGQERRTLSLNYILEEN